MPNLNSTLSRRATTGWYLAFQYLGILITVASSLVLVPLYLKFLPLDLYGAWLASGSILAWLTAVDPGLSQVIQQRVAVAYGRNDSAEVIRIINAGILLALGLSVVVLAIGVGISWAVPRMLDLDHGLHQPVAKAFRLAVWGTSASIFSFAISSANVGLQATRPVGLISTVVAALAVLINVTGLLLGYGIQAIAAGLVFSGVGLTAANLVYLLWRLRAERVTYRWSLIAVRPMASLTVFTFLGRLGNQIATSFDTVLVAGALGPSEVAVFELTRKIPMVGRLVAERPSSAIMPAVSHLVGTGELHKARAVLTRLLRMEFWALGLIIGGLIAFNDDLIALWIGTQYFAGWGINVVVCLTVGTWVLTNTLTGLCLALGDIKGNSIASLLQSLVQVAFLFIGIRFGLLGVALASLLGKLAVSVWYYPRSFARVLSLEREQVRGLIWELVLTSASAGVLAFAFAALPIANWTMFVVGCSLFSASYAAACATLSRELRMELRNANHLCTGILQRAMARRPQD